MFDNDVSRDEFCGAAGARCGSLLSKIGSGAVVDAADWELDSLVEARQKTY